MTNRTMNTCRLCGGYEGLLVKYAVRHYAHADCALNKWGAAFFDRLTPHQCRSQFPYMVAVKHGVADQLIDRAELASKDPAERHHHLTEGVQ